MFFVLMQNTQMISIHQTDTFPTLWQWDCARRDDDVHQRMNAKVYRHMIYSPETESKYDNEITMRLQYIISWCVDNIYT
jgi:hypothetical protein